MLSDKQREQFNEQGFLVLEEVVPEATLQTVEEDISIRLDELAAYLNVSLSNSRADINNKMLEIECQNPGASLIFTHSNIMSAGMFGLWNAESLLAVASSLLGDDIDGHPFWAVRPKPPEVDLFIVPWHQDSAYLRKEAGGSPSLSVWVPIFDVMQESGCMEFARKQHKQGELVHLSHEHREYGNDSWYVEIKPELSKSFETQICEMKRGSCVIFSPLTPHRSLTNLSDRCRWSVDFRYLAAGYPAGTQQSSIPFLRENEQSQADQAKQAYLDKQLARDRNFWRHRVENAGWKDRWA